ncbi:hypothetical protein GCM10010402_18280 [Actinomadura luteofluorescens]|uniref:hypothetical protein n=1 Tax=Actinomadura luteofluorescens TaxID=46163 RepID=UPI002164B570|nr:hypothetical protein [Actinomadura glauciflava]MCR3740345.1 hypothetical protein [Actinomadura glauciflava]
MGFTKENGAAKLGEPSEAVPPQGKLAAFLVAALVIGETGVILQLFFNVIKEEGPIMTSFLQTVVGTALLWCVVRPKLNAGWPLWWRALAVGGSSVVSLVAAREAMTLVPYGTITCLAFVFGPMFAMTFRIGRAAKARTLKRKWTIASPFLAAASVFLLVDGLGSGDLVGFGLIGLVALAYHVYATTTSGLQREDVNTVATLARLPTVLLLTGMLFSAEAPSALLHVSGQAWWVCSVSGAVGVVALLMINAAWKRGLTVTTHAGVMPVDNGLAMVDGMLAGQFPSLANWFGAGLVVAAEVGATRARIPDGDKPSKFAAFMDGLPPRIARLMSMCVRYVRNTRLARLVRTCVARVRSKEKPEG